MSRLVDSAPAARSADLPFIDSYSIEIDAPRERVWDAIVGSVLPHLGGGIGRLGPLGARAVGCPYTAVTPVRATVPATIVGFRVERAERPSLVELVGEHRFARYALVLGVQPAGQGARSVVSAQTRAIFPGAAGRVYRAAVIGTGAHVLVVRRLLEQVGRAARGV